jgi:ankyrin repeat protein
MSKDGSTALIKASVRGHVDIITLLLEAGADIDEKNNVSRKY